MWLWQLPRCYIIVSTRALGSLIVVGRMFSFALFMFTALTWLILSVLVRTWIIGDRNLSVVLIYRIASRSIAHHHNGITDNGVSSLADAVLQSVRWTCLLVSPETCYAWRYCLLQLSVSRSNGCSWSDLMKFMICGRRCSFGDWSFLSWSPSWEKRYEPRTDR